MIFGRNTFGQVFGPRKSEVGPVTPGQGVSAFDAWFAYEGAAITTDFDVALLSRGDLSSSIDAVLLKTYTGATDFDVRLSQEAAGTTSIDAVFSKQGEVLTSFDTALFGIYSGSANFDAALSKQSKIGSLFDARLSKLQQYRTDIDAVLQKVWKDSASFDTYLLDITTGTGTAQIDVNLLLQKSVTASIDTVLTGTIEGATGFSVSLRTAADWQEIPDSDGTWTEIPNSDGTWTEI